ncbi:MAG TPA: peptidoglycan recognition family protein [Bacteriovoracaceae bacterium]|nr:peptidoglycan recognition family protein [Bacteriovoracaceae bacterium]
MKVINAHSPNFTSEQIPVEFLVIHYTACSLKRAQLIFDLPSPGVCAHFLIDTNGDLYDYGNFLNSPILKGAHAGESKYHFNGKVLNSFNNFSIGVEVVNLNGNLFDYTEMAVASQSTAINTSGSFLPAVSISSSLEEKSNRAFLLNHMTQKSL